ncbi:MAG: membrane-associated phospholipid phosphatase [Marivirga sp.]|jgi:membrane-associated phospholipid phosphatase
MESLKDKIQGPAFVMFVLYFITTLTISIFWEKGTFLLWLNDKHNAYGDVFFKYITYLGDGLIYLFMAVVFVTYRYYNVILLAITVVLQTIIVTIGKRLIFDLPRPRAFFENSDEILNMVEGVHVHTAHSFPSGHTASAFAIATLLICLTKNKLIQVLLMLAAILVAISRIYLLQHFLIDTVAGAFIGIFSAGSVWWYFTIKNTAILFDRRKLQGGLIIS